MADRKYYVLCGSNCKFEGMTKEQILAAIEQAVSTGEIKDVDTGFVTKIKEQNSGAPLTFWVGTTAQYNAIAEKAKNCFYIITDDTRGDDIETAFKRVNKDIKSLTEALAEHDAKNGKILYSGEWNGDYTIKIDGLSKYNVFLVNGVLCSRNYGGIFGTMRRCDWLHDDVYTITEYTITIPSARGDELLSSAIDANETQITYTVSVADGVKITNITRRAIEDIVGVK